ncbi:formylglycine-generating enzyme family protein [Haliscomenobacter sp.]|uniref:formylglycine-generating enzyme family protein n=1 Tax=Haliscomenobacter sp. TaxID=2717303 RepID=UPI003BAA1415
MQHRLRNHQFLALLFDELGSAGYIIDPSKYMRILVLVDNFNPSTPLSHYRSILCPIIASNPTEQQKFYGIFDQCILIQDALYSEEVPISESSEQKSSKRLRNQLKPVYYFKYLILLSLFVALHMDLRLLTPNQGSIHSQMPNSVFFYSTPGDSSKLFIPAPRYEIPYNKLTISNLNKKAQSNKGQLQIGANRQALYIANANAKSGQIDSVLVVFETLSRKDSVYYIAQIIDKLVSISGQQSIKKLVAIGQSSLIEEYRLIKINYWNIVFLLSVAFLFLTRKKFTRDWASKKKQHVSSSPPYVWSYHSDSSVPKVLGDKVQLIALQMQERRQGERQSIDLKATVDEFSRHPGQFAIQYQIETHAPQYLILIERKSPNDHRANLFNTLYLELLEAEIPISRYFFTGDPKVCYLESMAKGYPLAKLAEIYHDAQLIIISDGFALLSTANRQLAPWTLMLKSWQNRVLLSPKPLENWNINENTLGSFLPVFPASLGGLSAAIDLLKNMKPAYDLNEVKAMNNLGLTSFTIGINLIDSLLHRYRCEPEMVYWIAACAIWPDLNWKLSLEIGKELGAKYNTNLVSFEKLLALSSISWFVEGSIPDDHRKTLVRYLKEVGIEHDLRKMVMEIITKAELPPENSVAYDQYQSNLLLNRLVLSDSKAPGAHKLTRGFLDLLASGKAFDTVTFEFLQANFINLFNSSLISPGPQKKRMMQLRWHWILGVLLICGIVLIGLRKASLSIKIPTKNERLEQISSQISDAIKLQNHHQVDSLLNLVKVFFGDNPNVNNTTAIQYHNFVVDTVNQHYRNKPSINLPLSNSLQDFVCLNLNIALTFLREENEGIRTKIIQTKASIGCSLEIPYPEMVVVKGGRFKMGDVLNDHLYPNEKPVHMVELRDYLLGKYEVTFKQYDRFCEATQKLKPEDENWGRGNRPVINISWVDAVKFCNWLSEEHGLAKVYSTIHEDGSVQVNWEANGYRLPTEAEWEFAARQRGAIVRFGNGQNLADINTLNFNASEIDDYFSLQKGITRAQTVPVGSLNSQNALGIYDMSGNVWEWCWDRYGKYNNLMLANNPKGPNYRNLIRVYRGGSFGSFASNIRVSRRNFYNANKHFKVIGFRLARNK